MNVFYLGLAKLSSFNLSVDFYVDPFLISKNFLYNINCYAQFGILAKN